MFKSATSVHAVPSQLSVKALSGSSPPKNKPAVCIPAAPPFIRDVLISAISVHDEPFQDSTALSTGDVGVPDTAKAAV